MRRAHLLLAAVCFWATASPLHAQIYGPFYRPFGPYGYLGYFPGAYQNSWSNGFSLYGPPVPTYGSVPGTFGASDYRLNNNIQIQNGARIGLGTTGAGGAGPRMRHYAGGGYGNLPLAFDGMGQALIEVHVPTADAEVFFETINTRQQGTTRQFLSPRIPIGMTHFYKIRARWRADGDVQEQERAVGIRANEKTVVDFRQLEKPTDAPLLGKD